VTKQSIKEIEQIILSKMPKSRNQNPKQVQSNKVEQQASELLILDEAKLDDRRRQQIYAS
jgi:hypothetical protein